MKRLLLFCIVINCFQLIEARPKNVPKEAKYDEDVKSYILTEKIGVKIRRTMWSKGGELNSINYAEGDLHERTIYIGGRWFSRKKFHLREPIKKAVNLPPEYRPKGLPEKAVFNLDFKKWEDGEMRSGKKNGIWKLYWPTGENAGTLEYKDGLYHGDLKKVWENGKPCKTVKFVIGKKEGEEKWFFENGKLSETYLYKDGLLNGVYFRYNEKGKAVWKHYYEKGKLIKEEGVK